MSNQVNKIFTTHPTLDPELRNVPRKPRHYLVQHCRRHHVLMKLIFVSPNKFCVLVGSTSIVQTCSDRKLMVCSLISHQVSSSFLLGNLGSWFVSVGMVYCVMKTFVTFVKRLFRFDWILCWSTHLFVHCHPELTFEISVIFDRTSSLCDLTWGGRRRSCQ